MCMYELDVTRYQIRSVLAQCCSRIATVHLAQHLPSGTLVAVKKFQLDETKDEEGLIEHEIKVTRQLRHPNLLPYHTAFLSEFTLYVVTPFMSLGSCRDLIEYDYPDGLPEAVIAYVLRAVLKGLDYLHRKGFIHRAVRASHILVSETGHVCLSGLRYAGTVIRHCRWQRSIHSLPGNSSKNLNWLSPEMLEQNILGYSAKADVYSVGMTACELANGVVPFAETPTTLMFTEKLRGVVPPLLDCSTVPASEDVEPAPAGAEAQPLQSTSTGVHHTDSGVGESVASSSAERVRGFAARRFSEPFHQLAELCVLREPALRPTAAQMLSHSFFKQCRRGPTLAELLRDVSTAGDRGISTGTNVGEEQVVAEHLAGLDVNEEDWDF